MVLTVANATLHLTPCNDLWCRPSHNANAVVREQDFNRIQLQLNEVKMEKIQLEDEVKRARAGPCCLSPFNPFCVILSHAMPRLHVRERTHLRARYYDIIIRLRIYARARTHTHSTHGCLHSSLIRTLIYMRIVCTAADIFKNMHSETQKELKKAEKIIGKSKKLKETKTMVDALYDEVAELRLQNEVSVLLLPFQVQDVHPYVLFVGLASIDIMGASQFYRSVCSGSNAVRVTLVLFLHSVGGVLVGMFMDRQFLSLSVFLSPPIFFLLIVVSFTGSHNKPG